jgi:arylsulfatase
MADRPLNILHIFLDQMRADAIRALGNSVIKTPNIDRLCNEGVAFTNAYTPSPVCIAARCSMIYSQYPRSTGTYANTPMPQDGRESFMTALGRAGYRTHGVGKCHFAPDTYAMNGFEARERQEELPRDRDSDDYLRFLKDEGYDWVLDPHGVRSEMYYIPQVSLLPPSHHPVQWIGDRSVNFIEDASGGDRPWYLFSSFVHPHPPFAPPCPWHRIYSALEVPLPDVPDDPEQHWTIFNREQNRGKYRDRGRDLQLLRTMRAYYYACVSFIDHQVGRLIETLEARGELDNTLILFTADHGDYLGDKNCFGKRGMHQQPANIPMIARCPGLFEGGGRCTAPASLVDLGPTFMARAGVKYESHAPEGVDLAELLAGTAERDAVFSQFGLPVLDGDGIAHRPLEASCLHMIATDRYTYIRSIPDDRSYLYDRRIDPRQTVNRASNARLKGPEEELDERLRAFLAEAGGCGALDGAGAWKRYPPSTMPQDLEEGLGQQWNPWADYSVPGYSDAED